jgi:hypothetical protein
MTEPTKKEIKETRTQPRFIFKKPVEAAFNAYPIAILNLSSGGAAIEHVDPLKLHSTAKLVVPLPHSSETITLRGQLLWSRLSRMPNREGKHLYQSGLRFEGQGATVSSMSQRIITAYGGEEDEQSFQRKIEMLRERAAKDALRQQGRSLDSTWRRATAPAPPQIDADQALLVEQTLERLKTTPPEILRLALRARKLLEQKGEGFSYSDDTLAVWEYLERLVSLKVVSQVLEKGKR